MKYLLSLAAILLLAAGCNQAAKSAADSEDNRSSSSSAAPTEPYRTDQKFTDVTSLTIINSPGENKSAAYVTSQCYTKTLDDKGVAHNPCFTCHINSTEPNYIDDAWIQETYAFSETTKTNPWTSLFVDRTAEVAAISDDVMRAYVRADNYKDGNGTIMLNAILQNVPSEWDYDKDGKWNGYRPDCAFDFDDEGFDRDGSGGYTGWRAFGYYPFLGTFWPTNGSTDDVLIRLHPVLQQDDSGAFDLSVYKVNLAVVESLFKQTDVVIAPVDENRFGVDLNQNGVLDTAEKVVFRWEKPKYDIANNKIYDFSMHYVGHAKAAQDENILHIAPGLYPEQTEFLHTVRYIDVDENGTVSMGKRMKELRYGRKTSWSTYGELSNIANAELKEKQLNPYRLKKIVGNAENGLQTGQGWVYQGFIEDAEGYLRPQTYEETLFCIGCHSGIGATVDSTFVFPRKFDDRAKQMGWYHWTQSETGFKGIKEPLLADGRYEYSLYLETNHAGDEFRGNDEVYKKFFDAAGNLKSDEIDTLHNDMAHLIIPSAARAMELNKAYRVIVQEQSFAYGRDAHVAPVANVHKNVAIDTPTDAAAVTMERYPLR